MSHFAAKTKVQKLAQPGSMLLLLPIAVAIISLASLLLVVQTSRVTATGYYIQRLKQDKESWLQKNYQLEAEVAALQSLDRIEREATTKLKMVPASHYVFIEVNRLSQRGVKSEEAPPSHRKDPDAERQSTKWWETIFDLLAIGRGANSVAIR